MAIDIVNNSWYESLLDGINVNNKVLDTPNTNNLKTFENIFFLSISIIIYIYIYIYNILLL
jgi:hypothetical protein